MRPPQTTLTLVASLLLVPFPTIGDSAPAEEKARNHDLLQLVAEVLKALDESENKPHYYHRTLRIAAEVQAKLGDRDAAKATLRRASQVAAAAKQAVGRQGDSVSYGLSSAWQLWEIGHSQVELGDKEGAREALIRRLQAKDEQNTSSLRIRTLVLIAREFTALGRPRRSAPGRRTSGHQLRGRWRSACANLLPDVVAAHAAAGDIDRAFAMLDEIANRRGDPVTRQSIITHSLGKIAEAVETADRATAQAVLDRVRLGLENAPKADALTKLAFAKAEIGDIDGSLQAARLIGGDLGMDFRAYALTTISSYQRKSGDRERVRQTLHEAYETAKLVPESQGKSGRLSEIAGGMIAVEDTDGACAASRTCSPVGARRPWRRSPRPRRSTATPKPRCATFRRALEDAESGREHRPRPGIDRPAIPADRGPDQDQWDAQVTRGVAKIQAMMGDYAAARKTAGSITIPVWRAFALGEVARVQAAAGDARGALEWCRQYKPSPKTQNPLEDVIWGIGEFVDDQAKRAPRRT